MFTNTELITIIMHIVLNNTTTAAQRTNLLDTAMALIE